MDTKNELRLKIAELAKQRDETNTKVEALTDLLSTKVQFTPEKTFWKLVVELKKLLVETAESPEKWNVKNAVHNFYCFNFAGNPLGFVQFYKSYCDKVYRLHKNQKLAINMDCGGDTFGDTLDTFPLFGSLRFNKTIRTGNPYTKMEDLEKKNANALWLGEHYIRTTLLNHIVLIAPHIAEDIETEKRVYRVVMHRTAVGCKTLDITASDKDEAEEIAYNTAGDYEYSTKDVEYEIESTMRID